MDGSSYCQGKYDVIVVGGGHAGCEAALAAARMGCKTLLLAINLDKIALMPCNPAIGGIGKGQLVREIDALGGEMGRNIDESMIQIRVLNRRKGPAVQALRAQADKKLYEDRMRRVLETQKNLSLHEGEVVELLADPEGVRGIITKTGVRYMSPTVVIATGTFLKGQIVLGDVTFPAGRVGELPSNHLSESLKGLGIELGRFQSATPPRVSEGSINFKKLILQPGDDEFLAFSFTSQRRRFRQKPCYLTYTNEKTHRVVRDHLYLSPLKTGLVSGRGPRYCPSIDRKIINFPDKTSHPVFVEPEGWHTAEMYLQGLTTSLPVEVQAKIIQTIPGLEEAQIIRPGYAVAYDYLLPDQLLPTLETKLIPGLFTAGQINGTSGYEEAAAQGIVAGINAALKVKEKAPLVLDRSQAYIGVLIDDLVTKGVDEPYRMFTSRAEYRLLLRSDNADLRLSPLGHELGLISKEQMKKVKEKEKKTLECWKKLQEKKIPASEEVNSFLTALGGSPLEQSIRANDLLKRPEVDFNLILRLIPQFKKYPLAVRTQSEIEVKYEGYIQRQREQIAVQQKMESRLMPPDINYTLMKGLSFEAREKLSRIQPRSLGQAARITGVSPADISIILLYLEERRRRERIQL